MDQASGGSSIGEAVSGRGVTHGVFVDEDDLFYIPERRASLDLGPLPMDFSHRYCFCSSSLLVVVGLFVKC